MLFSRRNHGTKALLQDATRASSRVAEQAQQTLSDLADDSRTLAQTARSELGGVSREMRDQASGKVSRARRRTARKLNEAAVTVEPGGKRRRRRPVVKVALAAVGGWVLVNVVRKARQKAEGSSSDAENAENAGTGGSTSGSTGSTSDPADAGAATGERPAERHTGRAEPASATATKANSSGS
jgi:hypothetical protein